MSIRHYDFSDIVELQGIIKVSAQSTLLAYFKQSTATYKNDGSIVTEADIAMHEVMGKALRHSYPGVALLSEELTEQEQSEVIRSGLDYWCLDPVDGTNNFHATLPLFSVSLALVCANEIVLGVIYDPMREEFFSSIKGQGMWVNSQPLQRPVQPDSVKRSIAFVDFKRLPLDIKLRLVSQTPYMCQRNLGSCALEWAWLAAGRVQLLLHGSEKYWDYAAGFLILNEAGGMSQTIEGESVFVEALVSRSVIATSNTELFQSWSDWIRSIE